MNSNIMQSINEIFNNEILKFAKRINAEYPDVPINGVLSIWCKQQHIPISTFDIDVDEDEYNADTEVEEKQKPSPKKKVVKKTVESEKTDSDFEKDDEEIESVPDADSDDEVENGKPKKAPKKEKAKKEKAPGKVCEHKYIKGKNAGTKCTTVIKGDGNFCSKHKAKV